MRAALLALVCALGLAACIPPAPPSAVYGVGDGYAAIDDVFGVYGPHVLGCAHAVAEVESHHDPNADNGSHHGLFQEHDGFWGSIVAAAGAYRRPASWYDPWQNASAAADAWLAAGGTFRVNWRGTAPGGC